MVGKAEASRQAESWLRAAAAAATVAAAIFVTDEAEGEGGDEGDDEDVREGNHCVEESPWLETHQRNQSKNKLNSHKGEGEGNVGKKLVPEASSFKRGCKHEDDGDASKPACHAKEDHCQQKNLVASLFTQLHLERTFEEKMEEVAYS